MEYVGEPSPQLCYLCKKEPDIINYLCQTCNIMVKDQLRDEIHIS